MSALQHHFEGGIHWPSSQRASPRLAFSQRDEACAFWDSYQYTEVSRDIGEFASESHCWPDLKCKSRCIPAIVTPQLVRQPCGHYISSRFHFFSALSLVWLLILFSVTTFCKSKQKKRMPVWRVWLNFKVRTQKEACICQRENYCIQYWIPQGWWLLR